jgi:hypothetical protein
MVSILKSKAGDDSGLKIVMAIIILLAILIVAVVIIMKYRDTAGNVGIGCNSENFGYCGCFFKTHTCPSEYAGKDLNSKLCPPDTVDCTDQTYGARMDEANKNAKALGREEQKKAYGTCCLGPLPVSKTRLIGYEGATAAEPQAVTAPGGASGTDSYGVPTLASQGVTVDCTRIDECEDYNTDLICYHDPCGVGRCVSFFSDCNNKNSFSECDDCPSSCTMSRYCQGADFTALRQKNPCRCT